MKELDLQSDLDFFFAESEFAKKAVVAGKEIPVIFDRAFQESVQGDVVVMNREPTMHAKSSDLESVARGTVVQIDGNDYEVCQLEPDGTGITVVILKGKK